MAMHVKLDTSEVLSPRVVYVAGLMIFLLALTTAMATPSLVRSLASGSCPASNMPSSEEEHEEARHGAPVSRAEVRRGEREIARPRVVRHIPRVLSRQTASLAARTPFFACPHLNGCGAVLRC